MDALTCKRPSRSGAEGDELSGCCFRSSSRFELARGREGSELREKGDGTHDDHGPFPCPPGLFAIAEHPEAETDADARVGQELGRESEDVLVRLERGTERALRELAAGLRVCVCGGGGYC